MNTQRGFTYFGVLFIVSLISLSLLGPSLAASIESRRNKEKQLIFIGKQYTQAISSYYRTGPDGLNQYPKTIESLLEDNRSPIPIRHLRKPFEDPFNPGKKIELIINRQGYIVGVRSSSKQTPIKQNNFGELNELLAGKTRYRDWRFTFGNFFEWDDDKI